MAILENEVWVGINPQNVDYFENKGYAIPRHIDRGIVRFKEGSKIKVKTEDLFKGSAVKVTKICDGCGKHIPNFLYTAINRQRNKTGGKDFCRHCSYKYHVVNKNNKIKYENTAEYYIKKNKLEYLIELFSNKNTKKLSELTKSPAGKFFWNCRKFGDKHEHPMTMHNKFQFPDSCPFCSGRKVNETNCLNTTHPHVAKLLYDINDGFTITQGSSKKLDFKCPDCNHVIKNKRLNNIVNSGLSCPKCGDGISYPEKYMYHLLNQLGVVFETQKIFDWSQNKRYDFYIPSHSVIIEVHGRQHYIGMDGLSRGKTLEEEIKNDILKKELARMNNIKYIEIDARFSESEYIKNNILISKLSTIFNLKNVEWEVCNRNACTSKIKQVAELFNQGLNSNEIEKVLDLPKQTCNVYLHKATLAKLCKYDPLPVKRETALNASMKIMRPVVQLTLRNEYVKEYRSIRNAAEQLNVDHATIGRVLNTKYRNKTGAGYKWMYKEDYDKYIEEKNNSLAN